MTDQEIDEIFQSVANDDPEVHRRFARAILKKAFTKPVAVVKRGGVEAFGKATMFLDWCPASKKLTDGLHYLYANPKDFS